MHALYIHQYFATPNGNTGTRSYEFARRLLKAGHHVTMLTSVAQLTPADLGGEPRGLVFRLTIDGIKVIALNVRYHQTMGFARRVWAFVLFSLLACWFVVRCPGVDLVYATSTPLTVGIPALAGRWLRRRRYAFEVRDLWPDLPIALGVVKNPVIVWCLRLLERSIYRGAEWVVAAAPGIKEGICRTGYPAERVSIIPNACDLDRFQPSGEALDDDRFGAADDFRLVFTGAHGLANGLDAVLDAVAELKRRGEKGLRFVFIGTGGQKPRLVSRSEREGLDSWISWVPSLPKEELARILPRMNVGMMILKNVPEFYYGTSPNKFFDYIAGGLAVLNNYPGWLAGMIEEHRCGLAVPPDDPVAFADAVVWMRDHREELAQMGARARTLAEQRFSRQVLGERFVVLLERLYNELKR
jgi:glycosyltransferase involved in cell wall biosynthesis